MITISFEDGQSVECQNLPVDEQACMPDKYLFWPNEDRAFFFGMTCWKLTGRKWEKIYNLVEKDDEVLGRRIVIDT